MANGYVFVYGTLRKGQANHDLIAKAYINCRPASITGLLYDLPEGYPAVVWGSGTVYGELYEFANLAEILPRLDELEGYAGPGECNEYDRLECLATPQQGDPVRCFVYVQSAEQIRAYGRLAKRVASGDWVQWRSGRRP